MLFVYVAADNYLRDGGRLGFVITQTVFKTSGAGEGFRRLKYEKDRQFVYLKPCAVHDLSRIQVFEGASNRTAVFLCEKKTKEFEYPVSHTSWSGPSRIDQTATLKEVREPVRMAEYGAIPVNPRQNNPPWHTAPRETLAGIKKVLGKSEYQAYAGCCTWLNGVFWIRILEKRKNGDLLIENLYDIGKLKIKQIQAMIEPDLVYPLLRGRDVKRWSAEPSAYIILTQDPETRTGIPESVMKTRFPKTFAYLKQFEGDHEKPQRGTLRGRSGFRQYFRPTDPFYSIYNIGSYTMADWKVLWPEVGNSVRSGVRGPLKLDKRKPALPDYTIVSVSCDSKEEAFYLNGALNSAPVDAAVRGYVALHPSPHVLENIAIPKFKSKNPIHRRIANIALECQKATETGDRYRLLHLEDDLEDATSELWAITKAELRAIQDALAALTSKGQQESKENDEDVVEQD